MIDYMFSCDGADVCGLPFAAWCVFPFVCFMFVILQNVSSLLMYDRQTLLYINKIVNCFVVIFNSEIALWNVELTLALQHISIIIDFE